MARATAKVAKAKTKGSPPAETAAEAGDWAACLDALLADWRETHDPEVAACIDRVSARAAGAAVGSKPSIAKAVAARISTATAVDVAPIVEIALRQIATTPKAYRWVVELADHLAAPDPRIATALVEIARYAPVTAMRRNAHGWLMGDVIEALVAQGDPRWRREVAAAAERIDAYRGRVLKYRRGLDILVAGAHEMRALPAPDVSHVDLAAIDRALAGDGRRVAKRGGDARELLAAIHADPADTGLRQIYADALIDAGDPRGEFIALQCARGDGDPPTKRERELLATYARPWLGDIEPLVGRTSVGYRRGFLAVAQARIMYTKHVPLLASPTWSTIEELDITGLAERSSADKIDLRALPVLRRVWGVTAEALAAHGRVPWSTIGVYDIRALAAVAKAAPSLAEVVVPGVAYDAAGELIARGRPVARRTCISPIHDHPRLNARVAALCTHVLGFGLELEVPDRDDWAGARAGCATRVRRSAEVDGAAEIELVVYGKLATDKACHLMNIVATERPIAKVIVTGARVTRSGPAWDALATAARARGAVLV